MACSGRWSFAIWPLVSVTWYYLAKVTSSRHSNTTGLLWSNFAAFPLHSDFRELII